MKRVLIFSHEFPPALGGAGSVAKRNAAALVAYGASTYVLSKAGAEDVEGASFVRLRVYSRFWFLSYVAFLILHKRWLSSFDLVLLNDPAAIYTAGLCFSNAELSKSLIFMHGSEIETIIERQSLIKHLQFFRYFFCRAISGGKKVVFPSNWLRQKFVNYPVVGHMFKRSSVVYAGINQNVFHEVKNDVRERLSIPDGAPIILSVSRIIKMKGYPEMYGIFKRLHIAGRRFHWVVVGDGDYIDELRELVNKDGLARYVHLLGGMPQSELRSYYSAADVFLLLSKFEEAYGLVYLEASAAGTPSIALRKGGVCEAIVEGKTGFIVDSVDECFDLLYRKAWKTLKSNDMKIFVAKVCSGGLLGLEEIGSLK